MYTKKKFLSNPKLTIPLIMLILIIISSTLTYSFSVFIAQILLAFITIPLLMKRDYKLAKLYLVIYIVSIFFVFLVYNANLMKYDAPYFIGGSDDLMFEQMGEKVYYSNIYNPQKLMELGVVPSWHNSSYFLVYIAILFKFANLFDGYTSFLPLIINVYLLMWVTMLFEYFLTKYSKFDNTKIKISIALFSLNPNIQYINSHIFRDTFNLFQVFLIIYVFDKIFSIRHLIKKPLYILLLGLLIYSTFYTRTSSLVFASAVCIFIIGEKLSIKKKYLILCILPIVLLSNFTEVIGLSAYVEGYSNYVLNQAGEGLSAVVFGQSLLPFGIILRALYAFITPFPNFLGLFNNFSSILYDITMVLIYLGVLLQILLIPFVIKRLLKMDWLAISFLTWFIAVIATTFTFRHIMLYYPFFIALAIDGYLVTKASTRKKILFISSIVGVSLAFIYLALKLLS